MNSIELLAILIASNSYRCMFFWNFKSNHVVYLLPSKQPIGCLFTLVLIVIWLCFYTISTDSALKYFRSYTLVNSRCVELVRPMKCLLWACKGAWPSSPGPTKNLIWEQVMINLNTCRFLSSVLPTCSWLCHALFMKYELYRFSFSISKFKCSS